MLKRRSGTNVIKARYKLLSPEQVLKAINAHDVTEVKQGSKNDSKLYTRVNRLLIIYELNNESWTEVHKVESFFAPSCLTSNYPWEVYDDGLLVVRTVEGVFVYRWKNGKLDPVLTASQYHDAYGYDDQDSTFLMGKIFPSDVNIGILTRLPSSSVEFRSLDPSTPSKPLQALQKSPGLSAEWSKPTSRISLIKNIDDKAQLSIGLRTESELQLYRFNEKFELVKLATVLQFPPIAEEYDRIVFAKIDETKFHDLLHFSPTGLMMYRYNETMAAFERVYYSTAFSTLRGWTKRTIETISTIDIVGDGMDELFASGPKGLVALQADFNEFGFALNNILDKRIAGQSIRYALPEHVRKVNISSDQIEVFLHTSQGLSAIKAAQYIPKNSCNICEPAKSEAVGPDNERSIPELVSQRTYTLWLHDQLDLSSILQPLNPHSGTVELTLPLIEVRNPFGVNVRKIFQYKNIDYSNELGHGWSFPLDSIMVDRTTSAFSEDHVYSLVKDNQRIILTRLRGQTELNDEIGFEIEGYDEMKIHYQQKMNQWNVTIDKRTLIYNVTNNYQMLNVCTTWPLCGSNSTKKVPHPTIWYLTMEFDHSGQGNARYDYEIVKNETDIRLRKITLQDDSTVEMAYDHDRVHYFSVKTAKYKQLVHIHYTTDNRHLRAITQSDRPLFDFEYDRENRLSKMVLPNGAVWIPNYFDLPIDSSALQKSFAINHEATIFYGPDYMVIVDANHVRGKLELHIRDPLGAMHEPKMNKTISVIAEPNFKNHIIHAIECLLVVNVVYSTHKVVTVIQYSDKGWVQRQCYENNPLEGMVMTGDKFVLISDTKQLHVLSVDETGAYQDAIVRRKLPKNFVIHAFSHGYATYDGQLRVFLLRESGNWLEVSASINWDAFAAIDNFISSFDINEQLADSIRKSLVADMLGSYRQAIFLKAPKFTATLLEMWVRFAVIDLKTHAPLMQCYYTTKVEMANMRDFKYTVRTQDNDEFILGYQWYSSKYHLRVRNSTGPHRDEFNRYSNEVQLSRPTMHYREWAELWNKTVTLIKQEYRRIYKKVKESVVFAMDLSQFGMLTNQEGVLVAGHQITNDGYSWPKKRISDETQRLYKVNQQLSAAYRLVKKHKHDNFKIVSSAHNSTVFDMGTTSPKEIQLVLPYYAQAQRPGGRLKAFFFDTQQTVTFAVNETIHRASNQLTLITTARELATRGRSYMLFRSVRYFITSNVTVLEKQTLTSPNERPLITEFQYNAKDLQLAANGFIFQRMQIVPGGNRTRFGWYEQSIDLATGDTLRKAFAADGREVVDKKLREQHKKEQQSETEESGSKLRDHERTIMDKSNRLQVLDLGPYRLADEMVSYYGFEQYENNLFGSQTRWIFNESLVCLESENRYLRLMGKNQTLTGVFMPAEPNNTFVVSCWIRLPVASLALQANQTSGALTVHVRRFAEDMKNTTSPTNVMTLSAAQIKQTIGRWNYIETIVDTSHFPPGTKLNFRIAVAPTDTLVVIEVDHIRFSPLSMPLAINIYKHITGEVRAVLNGNGLLRCCFYNPQGKKSIMFSEQGEVLEFSMDSKIMYTRQSRRRPCSVEMKPRYGSLDDFQTERWNMTGPGWTVEKGFVSYNGTQESTISKSFNKPYKTVGIRFLYELKKQEVRLSFDWRGKRFPLYCINNKPFKCPLPPLHAEILIVLTETRASIWLDGVLLRETVFTISAPNDHIFQLHTNGSFAVAEFLEMHEPRTKITYHTFSGHPVQLVVYEDADTVRVREIWYDQLERPVMQTKWTKVRVEPNVSHFFGFYENFITNMNDRTEIISGIVADLHPSCQGFPYTRTIYGNDPTDSKHLQGLPGKEYGVGGKYKRRYSNRPPSEWLDKIFPTSDGYYHKVGEHPGGALRLTVEDSLGNKVAKYSKVGNFEDRLTTYRYSAAAKLLQELPPLYHSTARSLAALSTPYFSRNFTDHQKALQKIWEVTYDYDEQQRMIRKRTPDGGVFNYLYDHHGALRFTLHKDQNETLDRAIHFLYSSNGKLAREAVVNLTYDQCKQMLENGTVPESRNSIETLYGEQDKLPATRYRSQLATRYIGDDQMTEYLIFGERESLLKKVFIVNTINTTYSIDFEWENDKLRSVQYPVSFGQGSMKYIYDYNGHGEVTSIRMPANKDPLFEFTYNADGMLETTTIQPGTEHSFQRNFTYNEPGFLVQIDDKYLSETISYLETDSYGQDSYTPIYEGLISRTFFTAHWQKSASALRNGIFPEYFLNDRTDLKQAAVCFEALQRTGYIDKNNNLVSKTFYGEWNDDLPFVCGDRIPMNHLTGVLSSKSFPHEYGHRYDYDDHDQMMKAKYFHGKDELKLTPLTHRSFAREIQSIDESNSKKIWDALTTGDFLSTDCTNPGLCHGRQGSKSMFKTFVQRHRFNKHLETMLSKAIVNRKALSEKDFMDKCQRWIEGSHVVIARCESVKKTLNHNRVLGNNPQGPLSSLQEEFVSVLRSFAHQIPDIVRVLTHHFATALGRSAGDVQSYEIDANGNHRMFYTGSTRYRMEYREGTNQITKVHRLSLDREQRKEQSFEMEHNSDGAVVKAEHKGIKKIEYDHIVHRVSKIEMLDGRRLEFQYDVRGERTFKQVLDTDGSVKHEKYYIRDGNGFVLVTMEMTYLENDQPPDARVTSYIYKDQQLMGFLRDDQLYNVITDHEGSVRVVIKDGEVVAAYDYLPYGQIFRQYGTDFDGQISYLYTGQEWEPETGLYNYRARLYDPDIGRFYQMDPKEQYASPYVYAGNSPVSLVDPDGEFAFAIACIVMALIGAYIGASSVARSWNPLKWDWKSTGLWLGLIGGALSGLSIPYNIASSVAYFVGLGLSLATSISIMVCSGITLAYFTMAAANGSWNPADFDFTSPATWNALLGGVAMSAFVIRNPNTLYNTFKSITSVFGRALFVTAKIGISLTFAYLFAVVKMGGQFDVTKWDFSDPGLYYSMFDAFVSVTSILTVVRNVPNTVRRFGAKIRTSLDRFADTEIFIRAHRLMRGDWSSKLSNVGFILRTNALAIANLQRGMLPIVFYTFIVSLRVAESYNKSPVPGFSVFLQILSTAVTTKGFSNRVVKPAFARVSNQPLALRLKGFPMDVHHTQHNVTSSGADRMGSVFDIFNMLYNWFTFGTTHAEKSTDSAQYTTISSNEKTDHKHDSKSSKSDSTIHNCYRVTQLGKDGDYVRCYSHRAIVSIYPKTSSMGTSDYYRLCLPLTYQGVPSISCDGERSKLLSMQLEAPKLFDYLNGWLLLARIVPAAFRETKHIIQTLLQPTKDRLQKSATRCKDELEKKFRKVRCLSDEAQTRWQMGWMKPLVDDVREDLNDYFHYGRGNYELLVERLEALEDDIEEELTLRRLAAFGTAFSTPSYRRLSSKESNLDLMPVVPRAMVSDGEAIAYHLWAPLSKEV